MRVIYFTNQPAPYQTEFQKALVNIDLTFVYEHALQGRPKNWAHTLSKNIYSSGPFSFFKILKKSNPDIVVMLGFKRLELYVSFLFKIIYSRNVSIIIFSETLRSEKSLKFRNSLLIKTYLWFINKFVKLVLCSNYHSLFQLELLGIPKNKLKIFNYPIIYNSNFLYQPKSINKKQLKVLFANRLTSIYKPKEAIKLFEIIKSKSNGAELYIFGQGPMLGEIKKAINSSKIKESIKLFDAVHINDLSKFYHEFDLLILPNKFGNGNATVMEASLCGVIPFVELNTCGSKEQIINRVIGFGHSTIREFTDNLDYLLSLSTEEIMVLKENGRKAFLNRTPQARAIHFEHILENMISNEF